MFFQTYGRLFTLILTHQLSTVLATLESGHMSTFTSRGSFHATEQLSFLGDDVYRNYNGTCSV